MEKEKIKIVFADNIPPSFDPTGDLFKSIAQLKSSNNNTRSIVLVIMAGLLSIFLVGNLVLYKYAHGSLPEKQQQKKKKVVSVKKMKKEKLKYGVSPPGE